METAAAPHQEATLVRPDVKAAWEAYAGFGKKKKDDEEEEDDDVSESSLCDRTLALSNLKLDECSVQFLANEWEELQQRQQQAGGADESHDENGDEAPEKKKQKTNGSPEESSDEATDKDDAGDDDEGEMKEEEDSEKSQQVARSVGSFVSFCSGRASLLPRLAISGNKVGVATAQQGTQLFRLAINKVAVATA